MASRALLVGIDEAGYGPVLGPLVVSAAAFEAPVELVDQGLWEVLEQAVCANASSRDGRIAIVDSKKLHKPRDGISRLERTALACIGAWRGWPPSLRAMCRLVCPDLQGQWEQYPWYRAVDPSLPRAADAGGIRLASRLLERALAANDLRLAGCWCEPLLEGHYNRLVAGTQNKATVLMGLTLRLIQRVADAYPRHEIRFFVDKQGARAHYARLLLRAFEDRRLKVIEESQDSSAYELVSGRSAWRISFQQAGESHHLPVALASILSKYVRELFMGCFNAYWSSHVPGLRPTAGYYEDGLRFLKDIEPHLARLGIPRETLVRER